ncbi:MAG TPA: TRAP transporter fused permease subunit [Thermodesulfobacteriota bacterium]
MSEPRLNEAQVQEILEKYEGGARKLHGWQRGLVGLLAVAVSLWGLWSAAGVVPAQIMRMVHVGLVLALVFLLYPARRAARPTLLDFAFALIGAAAMSRVVVDFDGFVERASFMDPADVVFGVATILLVLEAARRTTGWMLPALAVLALAYAFYGTWLPAPWGHRGYDLERVVGLQYMTLEGIFSTPIAVSATFIILFTVYGAVLDQSGAGKFFVDFSLAAMGRKRAGPGRTVTLASFLLGGPSGSGVATAVTLGSVTFPLLRQAGYSREAAGAVLSAGGIGAVLSPPVMGAASFIIAELTQVSYLKVIQWAVVPTVLYYLSIFLMIELDARTIGERRVDVDVPPLGPLVRRYWFHFTSLVAIVVFLAMGFSAMWAVFWCIAVAIATSFLRRETMLTPPKLLRALEGGALAILPVAATCAVAGILVGVVNLTGLGLKFSGIIVQFAGGSLFLTALYTALALLVLGLALPITASYIIAAVMLAPALKTVGVPEAAAHMFIFYYALLSEVSPPTALSCFAVSAITGGNPYRTMWITWKYALPAFVVPFMFVMTPEGMGLLLEGPLPQVALAVATAVVGIWALVAGAGGFLLRQASWPQRAILIAAGLALVYGHPAADAAGLAGFALVLGWQAIEGRRARAA